ncbi:MAG: tyrosine-type recombinase/integrase [Proteobacteria bacterium]|nr:tyrosine-type recombinase/integrase [Pseudomonadota bacterium]MBU1686300.1 tyrosine-type recombinase/integrase [Pseudomonadota bacterium]
MKGGIYTHQKCSICSQVLKDDGRRTLSCPDHPDQIASKFRVFFGKVNRRFDSYAEASRFLTGLRFKTDENSFDARDYSQSRPLGFSNLVKKWLVIKYESVKPGSYKNLRNYMTKAVKSWGNRNVKEIGYAEIEDFLIVSGRTLSTKTISNMKSALHDFFHWLEYREVISKVPRFPEIKVKLSFRKVIGKESQFLILDELQRIAPYKVWIGVKWLCTYVSIRPGELLQIREQDIDLENRYIYIHHSKTGETKPVPILDEDVQLVRQVGFTFPRSLFFVHAKTDRGCKLGQPYGLRYFYKWWKTACENLGIEDVDLYGGTRHSSVIALREFFTPEQIKQSTMHSTNKAFERYYRIESDDVRKIYSQSSLVGKKVVKKITTLRNTKR